jgi:hypothetical protein
MAVVSFTVRPIYPLRNSLHCPLDGMLFGPQYPSGRFGKKKILMSPPDIQMSVLGLYSVTVTVLTELLYSFQFGVCTDDIAFILSLRYRTGTVSLCV